jgi:hypothetical protein
MSKLFGFTIDDGNNKSPSTVSPVPQNNEDGSDYYLTSSFLNSYIDIEGVYKTEFDLIRRYREMSLHPEVDSAIEDIVNEAIVTDTNDSPVQIELSNLNASDGIKDIIRKEFKYILELLDFDKKAHQIYRNWYVDGRLFYHKVIDIKKPQEGIQELRYIDSLKMRHVRQEKKRKGNTLAKQGFLSENEINSSILPQIEEYFIYNPTVSYQSGTSTTMSVGSEKGIRFAKDSITYCTSGLVDRNKGTVLSWLNKAIKSLNQLRMIEDSIVIYRLTRSVERKAFYIDVGNLPPMKAEQFLKQNMARYRNREIYDPTTGEIKNGDRKFMSMMEDYWLPRRADGRATEIVTIPGGQNLGELSDLNFFLKKLYKSLNVPDSRISGDSGFNLGRSSEILRDEVKFSKFVGGLRKRFSRMFSDMLRTQLILKNVITPEDWKVMAEHIQFDFLYDNHFAELKNSELLGERLSMAATAEPYIGKYFSQDYVRRHILKQTDQEIIEEDLKIQQEIENGIIPDPSAPTDEMGNPIVEPPPQEPQAGNNIQGDSGKVPVEPKLDTSIVQPPTGGEI